MDTFIPKRVVKNSNDQAWITPKAKRLCKKKIHWFRMFKKTQSPQVKEKYLQIKKECKDECKKAKSQFLDKLCEGKDNKLFWSHIK